MTAVTWQIIVVVLAAGFVHALWNAIAKSFHDQWVSFTLLNLGIAVVCAIATPLIGLPRTAAWGYLGVSVVCHLGYEIFLMSAYRHGSLSVSYPMARGVAPALTTFGGAVIAREHLGTSELGGVALVVVGIVSLALLGRESTSRSAVLWALITGVAIAIYTVVDGLGVRASHAPLRYTCTLFVIQGTLFVAGAFAQRRRGWWPSRRRVALGVGGGVLSLVGYGAVLYAQVRAPLGVVSALRETGVVWAALLGIVWFKEAGSRWLVVAVALVVGGITCIAVG